MLPSLPRIPAVCAALPASSRPMSATTGPIAAGGRIASIHAVPTNLIMMATRHISRPVTTKPPSAYLKPRSGFVITMSAGDMNAKDEPR